MISTYSMTCGKFFFLGCHVVVVVIVVMVTLSLSGSSQVTRLSSRDDSIAINEIPEFATP